jgi:hypothetical protein
MNNKFNDKFETHEKGASGKTKRDFDVTIDI